MEHLTKNLGIRLGDGDEASMGRFRGRVNKLFKKMDKDRSERKLGAAKITPEALRMLADTFQDTLGMLAESLADRSGKMLIDEICLSLERFFFIDNLVVRIHLITEMI